jgi:cytochrome c oxidase subunit 1
VVNTALPLYFITHDSYWVVGHFHLILMGTVSLTFTGFIYYLFPLITGRMYNEKAARVHFALAFAGVAIVFLTQHILGLYGMPRRVYDYVPLPEYITMNQIATIGAWIAGWSYVIMIVNFLKNAGKGKEADMRDPFEIGEEYYDYARREPHH